MADKDRLVAKRMRKRTAAAGAGILGLALLLSWLLNLFNFGGGGDGGEGPDDPDQGQALVSAMDPEQDVIPADQPRLGDYQVLDILIDERLYLVRAGGSQDEYLAKPLAEVVRLADQASGNADGIRVRISRRKTARVSDQDNLTKALIDAGIVEDSILRQDEFVD